MLLDVPRYRGVKWLEPGDAVSRAELEEIERAEGVRLGEGDIFVFRTGHHRRRTELGAWDNGYDGEGKAGLHVDTIPWMHERGIAAFLPDGDGETVPSTVDEMLYPIHPLQVTAMGMVVSDSLQLEDIARACEEEGRWEFLVMACAAADQGRHRLAVQPDRGALMKTLEGRVAVVTGAASGVGLGIAEVLAQEGAQVVVVDVEAAAGERARRRRCARRVTTRWPSAADVVDRAAVDAMAAQVLERYGRIDIAAANAGIYPSAPIADDGRRRVRPGDGHQREGRAAHDPGVPAGDAPAAATGGSC